MLVATLLERLPELKEVVLERKSKLLDIQLSLFPRFEVEPSGKQIWEGYKLIVEVLYVIIVKSPSRFLRRFNYS